MTVQAPPVPAPLGTATATGTTAAVLTTSDAAGPGLVAVAAVNSAASGVSFNAPPVTVTSPGLAFTVLRTELYSYVNDYWRRRLTIALTPGPVPAGTQISAGRAQSSGVNVIAAAIPDAIRAVATYFGEGTGRDLSGTVDVPAAGLMVMGAGVTPGAWTGGTGNGWAAPMTTFASMSGQGLGTMNLGWAHPAATGPFSAAARAATGTVDDPWGMMLAAFSTEPAAATLRAWDGDQWLPVGTVPGMKAWDGGQWIHLDGQ